MKIAHVAIVSGLLGVILAGTAVAGDAWISDLHQPRSVQLATSEQYLYSTLHSEAEDPPQQPAEKSPSDVTNGGEAGNEVSASPRRRYRRRIRYDDPWTLPQPDGVRADGHTLALRGFLTCRGCGSREA